MSARRLLRNGSAFGLMGLAAAACAGPAGASPHIQTAAGRQHVIVLAPTGSDRAAGTVKDPMATLQAALAKLGHGGVIELEGGVYHQRVTLIGVSDIEIRPYARQHPVLSGAGLVPPGDISALIDISDSSQVTVQGLELTGYRTSTLNHVPAGVYIHGHDSGVHIIGNHVHDLGNYNPTLGSFDINAHGIAAYGDDPHAAIRGLVIAGNVVERLHLGASETVVVNGNVDGWQITGNTMVQLRRRHLCRWRDAHHDQPQYRSEQRHRR